ncbi:DUF6470 family protein [Paenibacillus sp. D2_2]|uniref:DUF6470 family protein n=1 Tax=Paenibacillus sp. D2_2 TaxID=3073092 RepID=UPI0028160D5D|nr:DUF6470 family protein [Paenibacillus sp. D2_2]WMT40665.1 DUF6470 family protein [Paenibacillus sp. D2_2]
MIPQIQITTQPSLLEMESSRAQILIKQPRGEMEIESPRADMRIVQPRPEMEIDQHEAWRAYNGGTALEMNRQIYSELPQLFLEGLAKRVEQGNQLAAIHLPGNTIAEIYGGDWQRNPFVEYRAPASYDNVNIHVEPHRPEINVTPMKPDIRGQQHNPEIDVQHGYLNIVVKQYASIQFTQPNIDVQM